MILLEIYILKYKRKKLLDGNELMKVIHNNINMRKNWRYLEWEGPCFEIYIYI